METELTTLKNKAWSSRAWWAPYLLVALFAPGAFSIFFFVYSVVWLPRLLSKLGFYAWAEKGVFKNVAVELGSREPSVFYVNLTLVFVGLGFFFLAQSQYASVCADAIRLLPYKEVVANFINCVQSHPDNFNLFCG